MDSTTFSPCLAAGAHEVGLPIAPCSHLSLLAHLLITLPFRHFRTHTVCAHPRSHPASRIPQTRSLSATLPDHSAPTQTYRVANLFLCDPFVFADLSDHLEAYRAWLPITFTVIGSNFPDELVSVLNASNFAKIISVVHHPRSIPPYYESARLVIALHQY